MRRNLPGLAGFGMRDSGEDWNGPISRLRSSFEKGPMYRPLLNSTSMIELKTSFNISVDVLLEGVRNIIKIPFFSPNFS